MIDHIALGLELYGAMRSRVPVAPLRGRVEGRDIEAAYRVSRAMLDCRLADGERVIGK